MFKIKNKVNLKNYEVNFEHLCETASEVISKKEFVTYNLVMFSSLKSVFVTPK